MKRFLSLILVLLLSFSFLAAAAFADDSDSDETVEYYFYDSSVFCDNMAESFAECRLDKGTMKSLCKANWDKTNDMLYIEIVDCFHEHDRLKSEIEALAPDKFAEDNLDLYNEKVQDLLTVHGEITDCYLELYSRGLVTEKQAADSIKKLSGESGAIAAADALGIKLAADGSYLPPEDPQ